MAQQIRELADAIVYLHLRGIVHGDVKAHNILISDDQHVQLCDFGLTKLANSGTTISLKGAGSVRWQSFELLNNEPKSLKSDVYAFAMTIVEVRKCTRINHRVLIYGLPTLGPYRPTALLKNWCRYRGYCGGVLEGPAARAGTREVARWDKLPECVDCGWTVLVAGCQRSDYNGASRWHLGSR